ncbi:MAG: cation:dicarboxylase symporter family transporter [Alphaproteobacteria bacterium]|nr:cation:dicarboxylase symporter family transporter [Alphaproteobacteria bacterium]
MSLASQVLLALVLGVVVGLFFGELVAPLKLVGQAFVRLLQVTVIPYIVVALITGLGRLTYDEVKALAVKGGSVLLVIWAITIFLVLVLPLSFPDWPSGSFFQKSSIETPAAPDFLQLYIPSNPFFSLANAIVPAIVVFSIMIGLALTGVHNKAIIVEPLLALGEILRKITSAIAKLAPLGVFSLIASAAGTISFEDLARLQVYVVVMVLLALVLGLWLLPGLVACVTPLHHGDILRRLRTPLITAFATGSSLVVLPMLAESCKSLIAEARAQAGVPDDEAEEDEEETESAVDVLIPTFYSFPSAGSVMALGFVPFAGWYIGSSVPGADLPAVLFAGLASLFGGTVLAIPFILSLAELPRDLFQVFLSVEVIGSRFGTYLGTVHYAAIGLIGTFALQGIPRFRLWPLLRLLIVGVGLVAVVLIGARAFYTYVVVVPYTKDDALKGLNTLRRPQPAVVHRQAPRAAPGAETGGPRSHSEIRNSGVLRVCYLAGNYPLSFFNTEGDLVGFDIEMAHRFAARLDLSLEFVPLERLSDAPARLDTGYCDALFSSLVMDLNRIDALSHTAPFNTATAAFLVPDRRRDQFATWRAIRQQGEITIATSAFQTLTRDISALLPQAKFVPLPSLAEQTRYFEADGQAADAFLNTAEQGAAWTILYPRVTVVVPRPVMQVPIVYALARDNPSLRRVMDEWLLIETRTGGIDELYDYWIQGKTEGVQPPRWSLGRDVLHWLD